MNLNYVLVYFIVTAPNRARPNALLIGCDF